MKSKKYLSLALVVTSLFGLAAISPVLAETTNGQGNSQENQGRAPKVAMMRPTVAGTVTAVSGNTVTMTSKRGFGMMGRGELRNRATSTATTTVTLKTVTYIVDATNAKVVKNNSTSTVSAITVGDNLLVQGTITGTNIVATNIRDGLMMNRGQDNGTGQDKNKKGTSTPPVLGSGQPIIAGNVSSVNGNTLTVTTGTNVTYTVDVTNAKFTQGQNAVTLTDVKVQDRVVVQGTVNGTAVVASNVMDQTRVNNNQNSDNQNKPKPGLFSRIGGFFSHMFGF